MRKQTIVFIFSTIITLNNWAQQNLVPNPSFENYSNCVTASGQIDYSLPWIGTNNSTDYYNSCAPACSLSVPCQNVASFQYAKTGSAFAGLWMSNGWAPYREYLQVMLTDTLKTGSCYLLTFYINLHNQVKYAVNNFGTYFSNNGFSTPTWGLPSYTPQLSGFNNEIINDTLNWVPIQGIYVASGGETHITIGNFYDDANTDTLATDNGTYIGAYYYFDDISLLPIDSIATSMVAYAGEDTLIMAGDSIFIGQEITNLNCNWYDEEGTSIATNISGIYVQPDTSTYYVMEQNLCGNITYDTVVISVIPLGIEELNNAMQFSIFPNPNSGTFSIVPFNTEVTDINIRIVDYTGKSVFSSHLISSNRLFESNLNLADGIYSIQITDNNSNETAVKRIVVLK